MAILVELEPSAAVSWSDAQGDTLWYGYGDVYFRDAEGAETIYASFDGQAFDRYWAPHILSFSAPSYETAERFGGFVKMNFGEVSFSPDAFASSWPPPKYGRIKILFTDTTEDAAMVIFDGNVYLTSYNETSVNYSLYAPTHSEKLLDEVTDYNGDTVATPRAFGYVSFVQPTRLPDDGASRPTYHLGGLDVGTDAQMIESFTSASGGTKTKITCTAAHGWSNGTSIAINGTTNFNGTYSIESASGASFVISKAFPTDNTEALPIHASAFTQGAFAVFDDGVPIQENVVNNGDGTFSLTETPVGTVSISGTGADTDLTGIMEWATSKLGIGTYDDSGGRGTSPGVNYWATSQMPLIDFVSDLCAFFTHFFYVKADQLYLCDMLLDNGTDSLDEFEYFTADYAATEAIKQLKAEWVTREAVEERLEDGVTSKVYVKDIDNETVVDGPYDWGSEKEITPYHDTLASITTALNNILTVLNKDTAVINIPIATTLPDPGKKLTFSDNQMLQDMSTYIWARRLQFDFARDEVMIEGEGVIS